MTEVGRIEVVKGYTQDEITDLQNKVKNSGVDHLIFDTDCNSSYSLPEIQAMEQFLAMHNKTQELKDKADNDGFFSWGFTSTKKANFEAAQANEQKYVNQYSEERNNNLSKIKAEEAKAKAEAEAKVKAEAEAKARVDAQNQYKKLVDDLAQYYPTTKSGTLDVEYVQSLSHEDLQAEANDCSEVLSNPENTSEREEKRLASLEKMLTFIDENGGIPELDAPYENTVDEKVLAEVEAQEKAEAQKEYIDLVYDLAQYYPSTESGTLDVEYVQSLSHEDLQTEANDCSEVLSNPENTSEREEKRLAALEKMLTFIDEKGGIPELDAPLVNIEDAAALKKAEEEKSLDLLNRLIDENQAKKAEQTKAAEAVEKSGTNSAATKYYTVALVNMFDDKMAKDDFDEFISLQGAVARTMPKKENGLYDMKAVRHLTLADLDVKIKDLTEQKESAEGKQKRQLANDLTAYENLRSFVVEHSDFLTMKEAPKEESGAVVKAAKATGSAVGATVDFVNDHVLRVSDARKGAKNAGKRVEAQWKANTDRDYGVSAVLSIAGNTAALGTSAASGILGTVTDATEALTDVVDNMDEGMAKDAAKAGSGIVKIGNSVINGGAAVIDGVGDVLKNGFYINKLWGGKSNDEAVDELTRDAFASISGNMIKASLKPDATDEEKEAYEKALKKERVEYGYIVDIKQRLGLSDAQLEEMSDEEIRTKIVDSIEKEIIPVDLIKAFSATPIMEQGMKEQSQLLTTDAAEGYAKAKKAGNQFVEGITDIASGVGNFITFGLFRSEPENDVEPVKTQAAREITQTQRDIQISAWRADFMPKLEENKTKIIDKMVPADFIKGAIEDTLEENYDVENLSQEDLAKARATVKQAIYNQLGAELENKFSEFEKHRLFVRAQNEGTFGKDSFWTDFWNYMDDAHAQENNAGDRGFWENFKSTALSFATAPVKALTTDAPYTIAQLAGGVPFIEHQCFFMMLFGSSEHLEGLENIIDGKYNGAQKNAGYSQQGYGLAKDWFIKWSKHHATKALQQENHCPCKPVKPTDPDDIFLNNPEDFVLED